MTPTLTDIAIVGAVVIAAIAFETWWDTRRPKRGEPMPEQPNKELQP